MSRAPEQLDAGLVGRLRQVIAGQVATETELRTLADEADGWARATRARLEAAEERLAVLNANPSSPLAEIAREMRRIDALTREAGESRRLIEGLKQRARELRTEWLKHHAEAGSPFEPKT